MYGNELKKFVLEMLQKWKWAKKLDKENIIFIFLGKVEIMTYKENLDVNINFCLEMWMMLQANNCFEVTPLKSGQGVKYFHFYTKLCNITLITF